MKRRRRRVTPAYQHARSSDDGCVWLVWSIVAAAGAVVVLYVFIL